MPVPSGIVHLTSSGACSWHEFTVAIMARAGLEVPVEPVETVIPNGGVDRPLNGVLGASSRRCVEPAGAQALGRRAQRLHAAG